MKKLKLSVSCQHLFKKPVFISDNLKTFRTSKKLLPGCLFLFLNSVDAEIGLHTTHYNKVSYLHELHSQT